MKPAAIHPARFDDIPALCELYHAFHEFHVSGVPERLKTLGLWEDFDASQLARSLERILKDPKACLIVAEEDELVGFAEVYLREDEPDTARVAYVYGHLQSLMVTTSRRGVGIGKRLLQAAESWAAQKGATEMRLDTWEFPGDPVQFYEKSGYRTLRRTLMRKV